MPVVLTPKVKPPVELPNEAVLLPTLVLPNVKPELSPLPQPVLLLLPNALPLLLPKENPENPELLLPNPALEPKDVLFPLPHPKPVLALLPKVELELLLPKPVVPLFPNEKPEPELPDSEKGFAASAVELLLYFAVQQCSHTEAVDADFHSHAVCTPDSILILADGDRLTLNIGARKRGDRHERKH